MQFWYFPANTLYHRAQKTSAVFQTAAIFPWTGIGTEKLVSQIAVAMLEIDKVKTNFIHQMRRPDVIVYELIDFLIRKNNRIIIGVDAKFPVQNGVMIKNPGASLPGLGRQNRPEW